jgi:hypothetical protein
LSKSGADSSSRTPIYKLSVFGLQVKMFLHTFVIFGGRLIDNCAVFQAPQVEHPNTTVCATADKNINTVGTEPNIKNLFVMSN